ncbi:hypothetical protein KIPB_009362, partial [Kipferlia bialata]
GHSALAAMLDDYLDRFGDTPRHQVSALRSGLLSTPSAKTGTFIGGGRETEREGERERESVSRRSSVDGIDTRREAEREPCRERERTVEGSQQRHLGSDPAIETLISTCAREAAKVVLSQLGPMRSAPQPRVSLDRVGDRVSESVTRQRDSISLAGVRPAPVTKGKTKKGKRTRKTVSKKEGKRKERERERGRERGRARVLDSEIQRVERNLEAVYLQERRKARERENQAPCTVRSRSPSRERHLPLTLPCAPVSQQKSSEGAGPQRSRPRSRSRERSMSRGKSVTAAVSVEEMQSDLRRYESQLAVAYETIRELRSENTNLRNQLKAGNRARATSRERERSCSRERERERDIGQVQTILNEIRQRERERELV